MDVPATFLPLLQVFAGKMTRPTFQNFLLLVSGWLVASRRTILGMLRAGGIQRHHAAFHRIFASARWSIDTIGPAVSDRVTRSGSIVFWPLMTP